MRRQRSFTKSSSLLSEAATASGNPGAIQAALEKLRGFTNCRLLRPLVQLIVDKRAVSLDVAENGKVGKLQVRIGDLSISAFTASFGKQVTGEQDVQWKSHTDVEMQRIYQRVKKAVESGKFSIAVLQDKGSAGYLELIVRPCSALISA